MGKWKKIIAVSVVLIMLASAGTVYYLYDQGFFGPTYGDMDGYYFDFEGSSEIGLCNVEMVETEITNAGILDTISLASNSVEQAGTSVSKNHRPVSHDNYLVAPSRVHSQLKNVQSKLFFDDEHGLSWDVCEGPDQGKRDGVSLYEYNDIWRCWALRPSDAQREETQWE